MAGERQVFGCVFSPMLPRDDVLDMKRGQCLKLLMKMAILAAVAGSFLDQSAQSRLHQEARFASHVLALACSTEIRSAAWT